MAGGIGVIIAPLWVEGNNCSVGYTLVMRTMGGGLILSNGSKLFCHFSVSLIQSSNF